MLHYLLYIITMKKTIKEIREQLKYSDSAEVEHNGYMIYVDIANNGDLIVDYDTPDEKESIRVSALVRSKVKEG